MEVGDDLIGRVLGRCQILKQLGSGGMGTVYLAKHQVLDKQVAVKVLARELVTDQEFVKRLVREAKLAAKLEHPNIVQIYDAGQENGTPFIVMQYVDGRTLHQVISTKGKMSIKESLGVTRRVALALAAAHRLGIVHRDIKPSNVLISTDGKVKVADFGLARSMDPGDGSLTSTNVILGTPQYMSPEQARGEAIDGRSDLYSLGAMLYVMLTGAPPFDSGSPASIVLQQASEQVQLQDPRKIVADLPAPVAQFVLKLMAKPLKDRYQTAEEAVHAIDALTPATGRVSKAPTPWYRRKRWLYVAAGAMALGSIAWIAWPRESEAERLFHEAEAVTDTERSMFKFQEAAEKFPDTLWGKRSNEKAKALRERLEDDKELQALKTAQDYARKNEIDYEGSREHLNAFVLEHPNSKHKNKAVEDIRQVHERELRDRCEKLGKLCVNGKPQEIREFLDRERVDKVGQLFVDLYIDAYLKNLRKSGYKGLRIMEVELKEPIEQAILRTKFQLQASGSPSPYEADEPLVWTFDKRMWHFDPQETERHKEHEIRNLTLDESEEWKRAKSYFQNVPGDYAWTRVRLEAFSSHHPNSPHAAEAQEILSTINKADLTARKKEIAQIAQDRSNPLQKEILLSRYIYRPQSKPPGMGLVNKTRDWMLHIPQADSKEWTITNVEFGDVQLAPGGKTAYIPLTVSGSRTQGSETKKVTHTTTWELHENTWKWKLEIDKH